MYADKEFSASLSCAKSMYGFITNHTTQIIAVSCQWARVLVALDFSGAVCAGDGGGVYCE